MEEVISPMLMSRSTTRTFSGMPSMGNGFEPLPCACKSSMIESRVTPGRTMPLSSDMVMNSRTDRQL